MLYSTKRQKCIFTIINIIVIVTFLWSNLVWAGGLYSARSPVSSNKDTLSPSSGLPALLTDATVDAIALETIKTLGSGNLSDIKVFYQQSLEEELRQKCGDVRCFGIQDVKREKGKWAFYVVDLDKNELIRFTTARDISDLFFNELKDITVRAGEEFKANSSYTFNLNGKDYIREVYSITSKNSPFIQMCLDRIHTYPKTVSIEGVEFTGTEYSEIIRLRGLLKGKTVLFMGPSNSGKGFYGKRIARLLGLKHVSYGDMVREVGNTTRDGDLRRVIEEASQKGGLLPDNIAESILKEGLKDIPEGIILDGFPRTVEQAMMLDTIRPVDVVILLETPEEALYDFIESRVVCKKCGEVYSKRFTRPKDPSFRCDHCGGELVRRVTPDGRLIDTRETLERKLLTYNKETVSVINYYSGRGIVNRFCTKAGSDVPEHLLETEYDEQTGSRNIYITPKGERILNFTGAIKNSLVLFKTPFLNGLREIEDFISANPTAGLKEIEDKVDEIYNRLAASVRVPPHILARWKIELYMSAFGEIDPSYTKSLFQIYNKLIQPESDFILFVTSLSQETSIPLKRFYRAIFPNYNEEINTVSIFEFNFSPDDYFRIMKLGIHLQSKKIIIQGPPGSGKGFWGERLAGILGMQHISFGDYVREIGSTTSDAELRQAIQEAADKGGVIADEYAFRIMEGIMNQCNGDVILEGFPRTVRQAEWLVDKTGIDAVIEIDVPKSLLFDRVQGRVVCSECGLVYNLLFDDLNYNETREPICKRDGKVLTRRMTPDGTAKDADRGVLERRLKFYFEETAPVHGVFSKRGKSFRVSNRVSPGETVPESNLQTVNVDGAKRIYSMTEDGSVVTVLNESSFVSRWLDVLEKVVSKEDVKDENRDSYYAREGLTFEEYVSFSLYESTLGYFSSGKVRFGWGGEKSHFATYPELLAEHKGRPFFGGMTAEQIFNMWKGMIEGGSIRKGEDFTIMEFGGGNGKYAYEILSYIRKKSTEDPEWRDFYNALKYKLVDIARDTEERLMPRFEEFGDKFSVEAGDARTLHDSKRSNIPDNSINGVILSFELIDNIPPHRVKVYPDGKIEVAVAMPKANRDKLAEFLGQLGCSDRLDEFKQINDDLIRDLEVTALDSHFYLGRRGLWLLEGLVRDYLAKNSKRKEEIDRMYQELISFEEKYIPSKYSQDVEQFYKENKNIIDSFASSLEGPRVVYIPVSGNNFIKGASRVLNKGYVVTMDYGGLFAHQYEYGFNEPFRTFPQSLGKEVNGDFYKVFLRGDLTYDVPFDFLVESGKRSDLSLEVFGKLGLLGCNTSYEDWLGHDRLHEVLSERFKEIGFPEDQLDRVICDLVLRNYKDYHRSMIYDPRNMQLLVQKKAGTESSWRIKHPIVDAKPDADFSRLNEERRKAIACVRETEAKVRENTDESRKYALEDELGYAKEYLQNARKELHEAEYLRYIRENIGYAPDGMVKTFPQQFDAEGGKVETIPADRLDTIEIDSNISKGVVLHVAMGQPLHIKVKLSGVISDIRDLRVMVRTNACSFDSTGNYIDSEISESFDHNVFTTMSRRDMELINVGRDLWEIDIPCDYCGNFYLTVYVVDPATNQRKWLGGDAYVSVFPSWVKGASIAVTSLRHMREKEPENMDRLGTFTDLEWDIRQKAEQGFNALLLLPITDTSEDSPYGQISPYALNPEHIDWEKVTSGVHVPPKDIEEAKRILQQLESEKEFQEWRAGQAQSGFFEDLKEYARLRAVKRMTQATHLELYAQILTLKRLIDNGTAQLKEEESGIINSLMGYIGLAIEKGVSFWDIEFTDNDFRIIDKIIDAYWNEDNQKQYGFFMSYYMPVINKLRLDMINRCEKGILFLGHVEFVLYEQFIAQKQLKEALRIAQSLNVHLLFDQPFFPSTEGAISVFHPERVEWMGPEGDRIKYAGCYGDSPDTYNEQHWVSLARWNYGAGSETVYKARLDAIAKPINYWVGFGFAGFRWDALHFGNYDLWQTLRNNYLQGKSVFPLGEQIGCLSSVERQLMNLGYILYKATQFQSYCPSALEDAFVESNWITWFVTADTHDSPRLYTLFKPYFQAGLGQNPDPILVNRAMLLEFAFASSVFCMMSGSEYGNTERINVPGVGTDWRGLSPHAVSASKGDLRGFVKKLNELRQTHPAMKAQGNLIKIDNSLGKGFQDEGGVSSLARLHENGSLVLVNNLSGFQQEVKVYIPFSLLHINPYKPFKIRNVLEEEGIKDIPPENYTLGNEYIGFRLEPGQSVIWELLPNDTISLEEWESKLEGETGLMRLLIALTPIQKRRLVYGSKNDAFVVTRYNKPIYSSPCSGLAGLQSIFNNVHDLWALNHHVEKGDFCNFLIQSVLIGDEFIELKKWFYNLMLVKDTPDRKREALQRAINSIMDILTPGMVKPVQMTYVLQAHQPPDDERKYKSWYRLHTLRSYYPTIASLYSKDMKGVRIGYSFSTTLLELIMGFNRSTEELFRIAEGYKDLGDLRLRIAQYLEAVERDTTTRIDKGFELLLKPCSEWTNEDRLYVVNSCWEVHPQYIAKIPGFVALRKRLGLEDPKVSYTKFIDQNQQVALANEDAKALLLAFTACYIAPQLRGKDVGLAGKDLDGKFTSDTVDFSKVYTVDFNFAEAAKDDVFCLSFALDQAKVMRMLPKTISLVSINNELKKAIETNTDLQSAIEEGNPEPYGGLKKSEFGHMELMACPGHIILPLFIDQRDALGKDGRPEGIYAYPFKAPRDAMYAIQYMKELFMSVMGVDIISVWPAECATSPDSLRMLRKEGILIAPVSQYAFERTKMLEEGKLIKDLQGYYFNCGDINGDGKDEFILVQPKNFGITIDFKIGPYSRNRDGNGPSDEQSVEIAAGEIRQKYTVVNGDTLYTLGYPIDSENAASNFSDWVGFWNNLWKTVRDKYSEVQLSSPMENLLNVKRFSAESNKDMVLPVIGDSGVGSWNDSLRTWAGKNEEQHRIWRLIDLTRNALVEAGVPYPAAPILEADTSEKKAWKALFGAETSCFPWHFDPDMRGNPGAYGDIFVRLLGEAIEHAWRAGYNVVPPFATKINSKKVYYIPRIAHYNHDYILDSEIMPEAVRERLAEFPVMRVGAQKIKHEFIEKGILRTKMAGCWETFEIFFDDFLPKDIDSDFRKGLKAQSETEGIVYTVHAPAFKDGGGYFKLDNDDDYKHFEDTVKFASDIGAEVVTIHFANTKESYVSAVKRLAEYARGLGVKIAIENTRSDSGAYCKPKDLNKLFRLLDGLDNVGICFDVGHANLTGMTPIEYMKRLHKKIKILNAHFHDNNGTNPDHLQIGQAFGRTDGIDFKAVLLELVKIGYEGSIIIEHGWDTLPFERRYIEEILDSVMMNARRPVGDVEREVAEKGLSPNQKLLEIFKMIDDTFEWAEREILPQDERLNKYYKGLSDRKPAVIARIVGNLTSHSSRFYGSFAQRRSAIFSLQYFENLLSFYKADKRSVNDARMFLFQILFSELGHTNKDYAPHEQGEKITDETKLIERDLQLLSLYKKVWSIESSTLAMMVFEWDNKYGLGDYHNLLLSLYFIRDDIERSKAISLYATSGEDDIRKLLNAAREEISYMLDWQRHIGAAVSPFRKMLKGIEEKRTADIKREPGHLVEELEKIRGLLDLVKNELINAKVPICKSTILEPKDDIERVWKAYFQAETDCYPLQFVSGPAEQFVLYMDTFVKHLGEAIEYAWHAGYNVIPPFATKIKGNKVYYIPKIIRNSKDYMLDLTNMPFAVREKLINLPLVLPGTRSERGKLIEESLSRAVRDNFRSFEIYFEGFLPNDIKPDFRQFLKTQAETQGLTLTVHAAWQHNPVEDPKIFTDIVEFARDIGSGVVTIHLTEPGKEYADAIRSLAILARSFGIRIAIENTRLDSGRWCMPEDLNNTLGYLEDLDNVGICLDVGHANLTGISPVEYLNLIDKRFKIFNVHFHDNNGKEDQHNTLGQAVGTKGGIDFKAVLARLAHRGYDDSIIIEHGRETLTVERKFIEDVVSGLSGQDEGDTPSGRGVETFAPTEGEDDIKERFLKEVEIFDMQPEPMQKVVTYIDESANPYITVKVQLGSLKPEDVNVEIHYGSQIAGADWGEIRDALMTSYKVIDSEKGTYLYRGKMPLFGLDLGAYRFTTKVSLKAYKDTQQKKEFIKWHNQPKNDGILVVTEYSELEKKILSLYPEAINWVRDHAERVARLSQIIAREIFDINRDVPRFSKELIRLAALAHDLGKGCSQEMIDLINSTSGFDPRVKRHIIEGVSAFRNAGIYIPIIEEVILNHHYYDIDGRCYGPRFIEDNDAKFIAEIIFVADQIEASQATSRGYKLGEIADIDKLCREMDEHKKAGRISDRVCNAVTTLLSERRRDFMDVIYEARKDIKWSAFVGLEADEKEQHPLEKKGPEEEEHLFTVTFDEYGKNVKTAEKKRTEKSSLYEEKYIIDALGVLVEKYEGPGILSGIKEIEVVNRTGPAENRVDSKARIDIDKFRDPDLVIKALEDEAIRKILALIMPDKPDLIEIFIANRSCKDGSVPEVRDVERSFTNILKLLNDLFWAGHGRQVRKNDLDALTIKELLKKGSRIRDELEREYITTDNDDYAGFLEWVFENSGDNIDLGALREKRRANRGKDTQGCLAARLGLSDDEVDLEKRGYRKLDVNGALDVLNSLGLDLSSYMDVSVDGGRRVERISCDEVWVGIQQGAVEVWVDEAGNRKMVKVKDIAIYNDKGIPSWGELIKEAVKGSLIEDAIKKMCGYSGRDGHLVDITGAERLIVVGDLHGNYRNLMAILSQGDIWDSLIEGKAHLVILGDAIHPGSGVLESPDSQEDSFRTLLLLIKLIMLLPNNIHYILGDHELTHICGQVHAVKESDSGKDVCQNIVFEDFLVSNYSAEFLRKIKGFFGNLPYVQRINKSTVLTHAGATEKAGNIEQIKELDMNDPEQVSLIADIIFRSGEGRDIAEDVINSFLSLTGCDLIITGHTVPNFINAEKYGFKVIKEGAIGEAYGKQIIIDSQSDSPGYMDMDLTRSDLKKGLGYLVDKEGRPALKTLGEDVLEEAVDEIYTILTKNWGIDIARNAVWEVVVGAKGESGAPKIERLIELVKETSQLELMDLFKLAQEISNPIGLISDRANSGGKLIANILEGILIKMEENRVKIAQGNNMREMFFNTVRELLVSYGAAKAEVTGILNFIKQGLFLLEFEPLLNIVKVANGYFDYLKFVCELCGVDEEALREIFSDSYSGYQEEQIFEKLGKRKEDIKPKDLEKELRRKGLWENYKRIEKIKEMIRDNFRNAEVVQNLDSPLSKAVRRLRLYKHIVDNKISGEVDINSGIAEDLVGLAEAVDFRRVSVDTPQALNKYLSLTSVAQEWGSYLVGKLDIDENKRQIVSIPEELFVGQKGGEYSLGLVAVLKQVHGLKVEIRTNDADKLNRIVDILKQSHPEMPGLEDRIKITDEFNNAGDVEERQNTVYVLGEGQENIGRDLEGKIKENTVKAFSAPGMALYGVVLYGALMASVEEMFGTDYKYTDEGIKVIQKLGYFVKDEELIEDIIINNRAFVIIKTEKLLEQYVLEMATIGISA